jgi:hypothetical protein
MRPDHRLVRQFAKRIDGQQTAGNILASPVITVALENPKQPRRRLAPLIVECAAIVFEPIGEGGILGRQAFEELAAPQGESLLQALPVIGPAEPLKLGNIGHDSGVME